jgi:mono/diheme cytochrome c family protein
VSRIALRAALLIATVYGYFLIFAQFSFVELIRAGGVDPTGEKIVLGAMAAGGIGAGFLVAWRGVTTSWLRAALAAAAILAALSPSLNMMPFAAVIGFSAGTALGIATVSLATLLRAWCGLFWVGLGTGIAYACCNLPWVFQADPARQAWIACGLAGLGALLVPGETECRIPTGKQPASSQGFWLIVLAFTALVWLDSAAFFIIQHESEMKAGTWGSGHLWRNAGLHFFAALLAGVWMCRGNVRTLPITAWGLLAVACLAVNDASTRAMAGWLYPVGVSIYSAALVAWPGWFGGAASQRQVGWRAAALFGVAGWFGSANGIGMAQALESVPGWFIAAAGLAVAAGTFLTSKGGWRIPSVFVFLTGVYLLGNRSEKLPSGSAIERGKQVYLSEGCINCHSQYIRPGSMDELLWGKGADANHATRQKPVLIGNRRQGPDLSNIGIRRSAVWLEQHFIDPQAFAPGSPMPSYAHLFRDHRGDDLIAYLASLGIERFGNRLEQISAWELTAPRESDHGPALFSKHCTVCHGAEGRGDGNIAGRFPKPPANLADGPFAWSAAGGDLPERLARIIKFGIPGTGMPGHETLTDGDIATLRAYVLSLRGEPFPFAPGTE